MPNNKRNQPDTGMAISNAADAMGHALECFRFLRQARISEEAYDLIIGSVTRDVIERMDIVRDAFGFDTLDTWPDKKDGD